MDVEKKSSFSLCRRVVHLTLTLFIFTSSLVHAGHWVSFVDQSAVKITDAHLKPTMDHQDEGLSGITIDYQFPGAEVSNVTHDGTEYQYISIDNFGKLGDVGKPALPQRVYTVAIPSGATPSIQILSEKKRTLESEYRIHPALPLAADYIGAPEPEFTIDKDFYSQDILYPADPVSIADIRMVRGTSIALVRICPVQYNPATGEVVVYSSLKFKINFKGAGKVIATESPVHHSMLSSVIINPQVTAQSDNTDALYFEKLLIVTISDFQAAADSLSKWKQQMGYQVRISSPASWSGSDMVKDSIHYYAQSDNYDFFVIIGDHSQVPSEWSTTGNYAHVTDLYYACLDGANDFVPDLGYGRISVSSASQALTVIQKIINYERNPVTTSSFYNAGVTAAYFQHDTLGYAERRFAQTSCEIRDYLISHGYTIDPIFCTGSSVSPLYWNDGKYSNGEPIPDSLRKPNFAWDGDAADVNSSINAGRFLVFHRDHGAENRWGNPYYSTYSVNSLQNGNLLPVVFSINCKTGRFDYTSDVFCETFLRHSNGGAVGIFGASQTSYSGPNDGLAEGLIDAIWPNPGLVPIFPHNANPAVTPHDTITQMGLVLNQGKLRMSETWNKLSNEQYTYEIFHYFGDPTMRIWTALPKTISATYSTSITVGQTTFDITNVSCGTGMATIFFNGQIIACGPITNGSATLAIDHVPTIAGTAVLTITARNYRPLIEELTVTPAEEMIAQTPSLGTIFDFGENVPITWYSYGSISSVSLEYSNDGGLNFNSIVNSTTNTGSYNWTAPSVQSQNYVIRISDAADGTPADTTDTFSILNLSTISGTVTPNSAAEIFYYDGPMSGSVNSNSLGVYSIERLQPGTYKIFAKLQNYYSDTVSVTVPGDQTVDLGVAYPEISVSPASISATLNAGASGSEVLAINNAGGGKLDFEIKGTSPQLQWLSFSTTAGLVAAGSSENVNILFDATGMVGGLYYDTAFISHNDTIADNPLKVPVSLTVVGVKLLAVQSSAIQFGSVMINTDSIQSIWLINNGSDTTTVSSINSDNALFSCTVSLPLKVPPFDSVYIPVTFSPSTQTLESASLVITSDAAVDPVLSVTLTGQGCVGPQIVVNPSDLRQTLFIGDTSDLPLRISNTGDNDLTFYIEIVDSSDADHSAVSVYDIYDASYFAELDKDVEDTRVGLPVTDGNGGPDLFGYRWKDSDEPDGPSFVWNDISATGTSISLSDDDYDNVNLSFSFPYYGNIYSEIFISSNGYITFGGGAISSSNTPIPNSGIPNNIVAAFWNDLGPGSNGTVYYQDFNDHIIVQYTDFIPYGGSTSDTYTFQIVLYESGKIVFYYEDMYAGDLQSATVGIENATGTDGLQVVYNAAYIHDGLAVELDYRPDWLTVTPLSGTVAPGSYLDLNVGFSAMERAAGEYYGRLSIVHNGTNINSPVIVPCTLIVNDTVMPVANFQLSGQQLNEGCGTAVIKAVLANTSAVDVEIPFTVTGTATIPGDHNLTGGIIIIPAGSLEDSVIFDVINDAIDEPDETIVATMGMPLNARAGNTTIHSITIIDDDSPPSVLFTEDSGNAAEADGSVAITAQLSSQSAFDVSIPFSLSGTATDGSDYTVTLSPITIPAGQTSTNVTVNIIDDILIEDNETLIVTMGIPANATSVAPTEYTLTINDDDQKPEVTFLIGSSQVAENAGTTVITVSLSLPSRVDVSVPFTVTGSAIAGDDYTVASSVLTIAAGQTSADFIITVVDDAIYENDETIILTMGTPVDATAGSITEHTVTITDDENLLTVLSDGNGTVSPDGDSVVNAGDTVNIIATPNAGYILDSWRVTSGSATIVNANALTTGVVVDNVPTTIEARFVQSGSIDISGVAANAEIFIYAAGGWFGKKVLTGAGVINNLRPGNVLLVVRQAGKRTEYVPLIVTEGGITQKLVNLRDPVPLIFSSAQSFQVDGNPVNTGSQSSAASEDIDSDGDRDLLVLLPDGDVIIYENNSSSLTASATITSGITGANCMRVCDWNGDGFSDILISSGNGIIYCITGKGGFEFSAVQTVYQSVDCSGFDICDLNGDALADFVIGKTDGTMDLALSNADGSWSSSSVLTSGGSVCDAGSNAAPLTMDLDGNGLEDLIVGTESGQIVWFRNNGGNTFTAMGIVNAGGVPLTCSGSARIARGYADEGDFSRIVVSDDAGAVQEVPAVLRGDFDNDGQVNFGDYMLFVNAWNLNESSAGWRPEINIVLSSGSQKVDFSDYIYFVNSWGKQK